MEDHIKEKCSRRDLDCHFEYAGCDVRKPKTELQKHMKDAVAAHLSLATDYIHNRITQQEIDVQVMTQDLVSARNRDFQSVRRELDEKHKECLQQIKELQARVQALTATVIIGAIAIAYYFFKSYSFS